MPVDRTGGDFAFLGPVAGRGVRFPQSAAARAPEPRTACSVAGGSCACIWTPHRQTYTGSPSMPDTQRTQGTQGGAQGMAAPGWYPAEPGAERYWDGATWTEHVRPLASAGVVAGA